MATAGRRTSAPLARFFQEFLERRASLPALEAAFRWFRASVEGSIHERSPAAYVESRWKQYESSAAKIVDSRLRPLILEAGKQPALRQLLPFTSMSTLCFSRTVGYPFASKGSPYAIPGASDLYRVFGPSETAGAGDEAAHLFGEGNATQASTWLASAIPHDWGPAIDGTEDDLSP